MLKELPQHSSLKFPEFVALAAMLMSLVALSIDAMLPALGEISRDLGVESENDIQFVISLFLLGIAIGQLVWGPLSDSFGRKPALLAGLGVFVVGALLSFLAQSFTVMLAGRVMQGIGVAGPRIVSISIIRDQYEGRRMARVMSFIMSVFMIVPILAPALGQGVMLLASWRAIFAAFLLLAVVVSLWFSIRQPETLPEELRSPFTFVRITSGFREVLRTRSALGSSVVAGLVFGAFIGYLSTAQQVFQEQYGLGRLFPLYFALLSLASAAASLTNARLVMHFGMKPLARLGLSAITILSLVFGGVAYAAQGQPPLWSLVTYLLLVFFCEGLLYSNMNALAMEDLGHIAGVGAAVIGALSLLISIICGTIIGQSYNGTVLPMVAGFGALSIASLATLRWADATAGRKSLGRLRLAANPRRSE